MRGSPPQPGDSAEYHFTYINQVPAGDIVDTLDRQGTEMRELLHDISDEQSLHRYAPGKWTIREVLSHINDTERVFSFRGYWFARNLGDPLPSFDQEVAIAVAGADARTWESHVAEWIAVRHSTLALFGNLPADAWQRRGVASGSEFTVNAMAYITAGHVQHHLRLLRERYLS